MLCSRRIESGCCTVQHTDDDPMPSGFENLDGLSEV